MAFLPSLERAQQAELISKTQTTSSMLMPPRTGVLPPARRLSLGAAAQLLTFHLSPFLIKKKRKDFVGSLVICYGCQACFSLSLLMSNNICKGNLYTCTQASLYTTVLCHPTRLSSISRGPGGRLLGCELCGRGEAKGAGAEAAKDQTGLQPSWAQQLSLVCVGFY